MPGSGENDEAPANSNQSILFASYSNENVTDSDQQPAMNASLIDIVSLESDLAATRLVVEEHELQIEKLKSDNSALRSAVDLLKKTDTNQKAKLKKLMQENDNLKRDISKHRGIRRYTTSDKSDSQTQLDKLREEIDVTQAKLASLRDSVRSYALSLIDLTDANPQSGNTLTIATNPSEGGDNAQNDDFQVVTRRGRRQHDDVDERHNRQADGDVSQHRNRQDEGQPSGEATVCPVTPPVSVAPPGGQTSDQGRVTQRSSAGPQRKSYAGALRERLPDTVVIGTSLVRGVGARLHQRGIDNTVYNFPGAQLPLIRNRLDNILVPGKIPKNIVIQAAGNDQRTDLVVREYEKLIKALKFRCPQSKIWLCKIPRRSRLSWLHSEIAKVNTFLEKSFHGKNVEFIDSCPEFGPRYFMNDMVHFNHNGVQVYGDKIACSMINFHVNQINHYR